MDESISWSSRVSALMLGDHAGASGAARWPAATAFARHQHLGGIPPQHWQQFVARGQRAVWSTIGKLVVADFRDGEARVEAHPLDHWGCASLDLRGYAAFCAREEAGVLQLELGR